MKDVESNLIEVQNLDIKKIEKDVLEKLDGLVQSVFGISLVQANIDQITDVINMEINTRIDSITVSAYSTRQVENFNPNNYGAVQIIDLKETYSYLRRAIAGIKDPAKLIKRYIDLKACMYKMIAYKYSSTEDFIRNLIRESELKDGAKAVGRFNET